MPLSPHDGERGTGKTLGQLREILTYIGPVKRVMYVLRHKQEIAYCMDMLAYHHPPEDVNFLHQIFKYPHLRLHFKCLDFVAEWTFDGPVIFDHWAIPKVCEMSAGAMGNRFREWRFMAISKNKIHEWPQGLGEYHDPNTT